MTLTPSAPCHPPPHPRSSCLLLQISKITLDQSELHKVNLKAITMGTSSKLHDGIPLKHFSIAVGKPLTKFIIKLINSQILYTVLSLDSTSSKILLLN